MIASHYAAPVERRIAEATILLDRPSGEAEVVRTLQPEETFALLDDSVGWAWGYAGDDRRVGYVRSEAIESSPRRMPGPQDDKDAGLLPR